MRKAGVLSILVAVVLLAVAVIAEAQQPKKVPRIGYLAAAALFRIVAPHRGVSARVYASLATLRERTSH